MTSEGGKIMRVSVKVQMFLASILLAVSSGGLGYTYGKRAATQWCATHPAVIEYHEQQLILRPGDVACPEGDLCMWKAVDVTTKKELGTVQP